MTRQIQPLNADYYRKAMGRLVTGVSIVTTRAAGIDHAMTVNSLTSVSLEPLLMLISVEREARFYDAVLESGEWAVSILPASARKHAAWLATRGRPLHGQLERIPHHLGEVTGLPLVDDALAEFECRTTQVHDAGDHTIVIGEVVNLALTENSGAEALTYVRGAFGTAV